MSAPARGGFGPVDSIEIRNFRGFEELAVTNLARVNFIVGDNGVGKTALLEAIFFVVSGHTQQPLQLKGWRGQDIVFNANSLDNVVEALYGDLFHDFASGEPITIKATGRGFENRELVVEKTAENLTIPVKPTGNRKQRRAAKTLQVGQAEIAPILLTWTDEHGEEHKARLVMAGGNMQFEATGETIPVSYLYAAQAPVPIAEAANHFSALKRRREANKFIEVFKAAFEEVRDISVESIGGTPTILVDVPWATQLLPLPTLSGGTNRAAAIMLAVTSRQDGLVLIDEVDNGIYHGRHGRFAQALLDLSETYGTQLVMTTHSDEFLRTVLQTVDNKDDVAFWRLERGGNRRPVLKRFSVEQFRTGMAMGEMR